MKVVVFGYDQLLLTSLEVLAPTGAEIVAAVFPSSRRDERANEIRAEVRTSGIPALEQPSKAEIGPFAERLRTWEPDLIFVWSYPMILPREVIEIPRLGCINLHMGLLPQYRGVNGLKWALLNGESETGVTLHYMDEGIDTGDMLAQISFPIMDGDDLVSLMRKARYAGLHLLKSSWPGLVKGTATPMPQDESIAGYYSAAMEPPREIDWSRPAAEIHNLIRASPPPFEGVHTFFRGERIVVRRASALEDGCSDEPGTVIAAGADGFTVAAAVGSLLVTGVEAGHNGEPAPYSQFGIEVGVRLGTSE